MGSTRRRSTKAGSVSKPPKVPKVMNQANARKLLEACGWACETGGKHVIKMVKAGERPITLPHDKQGRDYPASLRGAILREAGLKGR